MPELKNDQNVKSPRTQIDDLPEAGATLTAEDLQMVSGGMRAVGGCQCTCASTGCGCDCDYDQCDL